MSSVPASGDPPAAGAASIVGRAWTSATPSVIASSAGEHVYSRPRDGFPSAIAPMLSERAHPSHDRRVVRSTATAMRCPRDQSELAARVYEANVEIDECPTCAGCFLDRGELETIQAAMEREQTRATPPPAGSTRDPGEPLVDCPRCGARMERRAYGLGSQTIIDACPEGCGLWLDGGELQELEAFYEKSHAEVQIPLTWRIWAAVRGSFAKKKG
jgi:Zn-finger nucleic acid-binding protein